MKTTWLFCAQSTIIGDDSQLIKGYGGLSTGWCVTSQSNSNGLWNINEGATMKETKSPIVPRLKPKLPALWKRCSKEEFMDLIDKKMGVVTSCCNELDCTFTQFYSAVKHWGLQEHLTNAKEALTSLAEHSLVECLKSTDEKVKLQAALGALRLAV